ncbi:MAG: PilZ domain-containing protein [Candidatus Omnitrophica bacterium]|nr:PilZ domain-containing protein [Candidatus Omnitrophota bacterium]
MQAYKYRAKKGPATYIESIVYAKTKESAVDKIKELGYDEIEILGTVGLPEEDKRIFMRVDNNVYVKYKIFKIKDADAKNKKFDVELAAVTKNISAGGLLFQATDYLAPGTVIELTLELPQQASIQCLARVARVEEVELDASYEIAVYFLNITDYERARLNRFVAG